ncbi:thiamine biosynthesis protein ThiF [Veillonella atypica]|jgi:thiamine biosynthesis protein thiF|uniref:Thiamine biosynthesis protein ThiF n=1 Tax=Veillonella atypica TaxID=39777 RepID=A0A133S234_9FIRM|nr:sulfur carrier protein ThiS adenylyltransferase ThiF [Veillonella atypica]KXA62439.1 thiamine biosynthesis protein ThiF [Veillonella atypica]
MREATEFERALSKFYGTEELEALQQAVVGIFGAGGLGSNCAVSLARSGVTHFIVADFDVVELGNLNRQYFFPHHVGLYKVDALRDILLQINPAIEVTVYKEQLTAQTIPQMYSEAHILVEAFDGVDAKQMFFESTLEMKQPKVMVSGLAGIGNSDAIRIQALGDSMYMVGDGVSGIDTYLPFAPKVAIAANKEADIVLSLILGRPIV